MATDAQRLLEQALSLPEDQRADLAGNLIASLDTTIDANVDSAWQQEIDRRYREVASGESTTVSWAEIERKARAILNGD